LLARRPAIGEEALLKSRISPGACYDLGPECWSAGIEHLDLAPDFVGPEIALLNEQFPYRGLHDFVVAGFAVHGNRVVGMVVVRAHYAILSSQGGRSNVVWPYLDHRNRDAVVVEL